MQNKPNFQKSQMNLKSCNITAYENKRNWTIGENKPNSNPIQTQFKPNQTQFKANSNPNKANFRQEMPKMPYLPDCYIFISDLSARPSLCRCLWVDGQWQPGRGRLSYRPCPSEATRRPADLTIVPRKYRSYCSKQIPVLKRGKGACEDHLVACWKC